MNVTVVTGRLVRPPEHRTTSAGDQVELDLRAERPGGRAESVNVVWPDPPPSAASLTVDEVVLVVGRTRRRFFRSGGATGGRTEVVADGVVPLRRGATARSLLATAEAALAEGADELPAPRARRQVREAS